VRIIQRQLEQVEAEGSELVDEACAACNNHMDHMAFAVVGDRENMGMGPVEDGPEKCYHRVRNHFDDLL